MKDQSKIINELIKTIKQNVSYVEEDKRNKTFIDDHALKISWQ